MQHALSGGEDNGCRSWIHLWPGGEDEATPGQTDFLMAVSPTHLLALPAVRWVPQKSVKPLSSGSSSPPANFLPPRKTSAAAAQTCRPWIPHGPPPCRAQRYNHRSAGSCKAGAWGPRDPPGRQASFCPGSCWRNQPQLAGGRCPGTGPGQHGGAWDVRAERCTAWISPIHASISHQVCAKLVRYLIVSFVQLCRISES